MLSPSLAARLDTQLDSLPLVLRGAADAFTRRGPSGKWSAHENLAHVGRQHEVFLERLRRILEEDEPQLERYRAEDDPEWPRWQALPADEMLARLLALRRELAARLESLDDAQLARRGVHSFYGVMTVTEWTEFFLIHEAHHLYVVMGRVRGK
jgi:hypothetical protein